MLCMLVLVFQVYYLQQKIRQRERKVKIDKMFTTKLKLFVFT